MKLKNHKKMLWISKINVVLSVTLLTLAFFWTLKGKPFYGQLPSFLLGFTLLATAYLNIRRFKAESEGKTIADERSRRAVEKAGLFAFLLLLAGLMVSGVINSAFKLGMEYTSTIFLISFACLFAWMGITFYLDKKGEV